MAAAQSSRTVQEIWAHSKVAEEDRAMLTEQTSDTPIDRLQPVASAQEILGAIEEAKAVYVEESLNRYVVALLRHTRTDSRLYLGASPRAGIALLRVAKARALVAGRDYIKPDDVKAVAPAAALQERLDAAVESGWITQAVADERAAGLGPGELVQDALERTPVPV